MDRRFLLAMPAATPLATLPDACHRRRSMAAAIVLLSACSTGHDTLHVSPVEAPASGRTTVPQLTAAPDGGLLLSWEAAAPSGEHALMMSAWHRGTWGQVHTIVRDDSMFVHPTDLPSVTQLSDGRLGAVWQRTVRRPANRGLSYEFRVQFSADSGKAWSVPINPLGASPLGGEHEFHVAWPGANGALGLAWIDPRAQRVAAAATGGEAQYLGAMQLMSTTIDSGGRIAPIRVVDDVICECCPNAAAVTSRGPIIAYRDKRTPNSVPRDSLRYEMDVLRDLSLARLVPAGDTLVWESGQRVTEDNWIFNGCPNNGPALAARGDTVVLAWWTGEGDRPRVQLRWSLDAGATFAAPITVSEGRADGQVSVALTARGATVAWLQGREVVARRAARSGDMSTIAKLGDAVGRHRLPTMIPQPDSSVIVGWTGPDGRIQLRRVN